MVSKEIQISAGSFELDESYFSGVKKKTLASERRKRGRGAENKIPVFGIKKREDGRVYTDKFKSYDGLVFDGYKHERKRYSSGRGAHINGIVNFWSYAKQGLLV